MRIFNESKKDKYKAYQIDKKFEKNETINHILDFNNLSLEGFHSADLFSKYLIDKINNNKDIFVLTEDTKNKLFKTFKDHSKTIKEIENLLNDNKLDYEKYPDDYTHCLISNHIYCSIDNRVETKITNQLYIEKIKFNTPFNKVDFNDHIDKISNNINEDDHYHSVKVLEQLVNLNWLIYSKYITDGYKCIIYINEFNKQIVVGYQGIKFKLSDLFTKEYESYISLLNIFIRKHLKLIIKNVNECVKLSNDLNYSLSFTGYSFGALFAQLSVFICNKYLNKTQVKAVVFESIGLYELLDKLNNGTNKKNKIDLNDLDITIYLSYPNFFNTINKHVGKIVTPYDYCIQGKLKSCHLEECFIDKSQINCSYNNDNIDPFYVCGLKSFISLQLKSLYDNFKTSNFYIVNEWPINYKISISSKTNFIDIKPLNTKYQIYITSKYINKSLKLVFEKLKEIKTNQISNNNISCYFEFKKYLNIDKKIKDRNFFYKKGIYDKSSQLILLKEFFISSDHFLDNYIDLNKKYDLSKPITIVTGESGSGKSTFVAKHSRELISKCEYICFCWLDCSSFQNMKDCFYKLADYVSKSVMFSSNFDIHKFHSYGEYLKFNKLIEKYKNFYDCFQKVTKHLETHKIKTLIVFDNLSIFYHLKTLFKNDLIYSHVKIIITTNNFDPNTDCQEFEFNDYKIIKIDKLNKIECFSILKNSEIYLKNILNKKYKFNSFIDDLFRNEDDKKISINKIIFLKNMLKNKNNRLKTKQEILKYNEDIIDFIKYDNKTAFEFLSYIVYLDRNHLNLNLLKHVYRLIYNYDINFEKDISFNVNFKHDVEYLIEISVLNKVYDDYYVIQNSIYIEFENLKILTFEEKLKITFTNLVALNCNYELDSISGIFNEKRFYYKHIDLILSDYWKKKLRSFNDLFSFKVFENMIDKNTEIRFRYEGSISITLENVNQFIFEYNQKKIMQINEKRKSMYDRISELEKLLKDGLFYLYEDIKDIQNKIQLKLEEDIAEIKKENQIDINIDENDLDAIKYSDVIKKISFKKTLNSNSYNQIDKYYNKCSNSFNKSKNERDILIEEFKFYQYYDEYFNFVVRNLNSNGFHNEYRDYLNSKRVIKVFNLLKNELIGPVEKFINENLYNNYKISFYKIGLIFQQLDKINKKSSDSECSTISEEKFEQEMNLMIMNSNRCRLQSRSVQWYKSYPMPPRFS